MRGLIYTKLAVFIISAVAMLAWCLTLAGGLGPVATQPSVVNGSAKAWLIVRFVILGAANSATFASNSADYSRYAKRPHDVFWGNLVGFPMSSFIISMLGNIVAASSTLIFGKVSLTLCPVSFPVWLTCSSWFGTHSPCSICFKSATIPLQIERAASSFLSCLHTVDCSHRSSRIPCRLVMIPLHYFPSGSRYGGECIFVKSSLLLCSPGTY